MIKLPGYRMSWTSSEDPYLRPVSRGKLMIMTTTLNYKFLSEASYTSDLPLDFPT